MGRHALLLPLSVLLLLLLAAATARESTLCSHVKCKLATRTGVTSLRVLHHNHDSVCRSTHQCAMLAADETLCECHVLGTHPNGAMAQEHAHAVQVATELAGVQLAQFGAAMRSGVIAAVASELGVATAQTSIANARAPPPSASPPRVLFNLRVDTLSAGAAETARQALEDVSTTVARATGFGVLLREELLKTLTLSGESAAFLLDEHASAVRASFGMPEVSAAGQHA